MNSTVMTRPEHDPSGLGKAAALARRRQAGACGGESGMALVVTILIMVLMSALLIGFFATVVADQQASGVNRDQTQAYAAAHAGLERLTAGLGAMFTGGNYSPTAAQITALTTTPPSLSGFQYLAADGTSGYTITSGSLQTATIQNGPFQGLVGLITPYEINVTAKAPAGWAAAPRCTFVGSSRRSPCPCSSSGSTPRTTSASSPARVSTSAAGSTRTRTPTSHKTARRR